MSLAKETAAVSANYAANLDPQDLQTIGLATVELQTSFDPKSAIQIGASFPKFQLPNAVGEQVSSDDLFRSGPALITFYRGEWCPYCNLVLRDLQKHYDEFAARGVTLVAISPELPNQSLTATEKHDLKFVVLSDVGNKLARKLGILWLQPESLKPLYKALSYDLVGRNGDDSFGVPIPATLLVDRNGVLRNSFIDADYSKRLETTTALEWIDGLANGI